MVCPLYASNRSYVVFVGVQQAREGKVPDELVDRLMGILGHVMRLTTLKVKYSQLHYC
jgi:hypothetical protein